MTHRERVLTSLKRRQPDRVPVDLGGTLASTLNVHTYRRLMNHLGFGEDPPVAFLSRRSNSVLPDERLLQRLDVDCRAVILGNPDLHPERELPDGSLIDEWQTLWKHIGEGQHFINSGGPFSDKEPDPALVGTFTWPNPLDAGRFRTLRSQAQTLRVASDAASSSSWVWAPSIRSSSCAGTRRRWKISSPLRISCRPSWIVTRTSGRCMTERALEEVGDLVDLAMFGDDLGTQQGPVMSPAVYRRLIKPAHARMVKAVKKFNKPVLLHSCGSVAAFIPDLVEIGIDALHPVQVSAKGMDTAQLKKEFGRDITFWGGIDTHRVLPRGTPGDVRDEVRRRIADLAPGGGYVLGAVHNIQAEVPVENVLAMVEAAKEFGRY